MKKLNLLLLAAAIVFMGACTVYDENDPLAGFLNPDENNGNDDQEQVDPIEPGDFVETVIPRFSTVPVFVTDNMTENVVVRLNTEGTVFDDAEFSGTIYAHAGVLTTNSTDTSDWKYVKSDWGDNVEACKLEKKSANLWYFNIPGGPRKFYGVPADEKITHLAFVFRSDDSTIELKDNGNDIMLPISEGGLDVKFTSPMDGSVWESGLTYTVTIRANEADYIKLYKNDVEVASTQGTSGLNFEYTPAGAENITFRGEAGKGSETKSVEIKVSILGDTIEEARPADAKEGVTVNGDQATFVIYAPGKGMVNLLGDFNDFTISGDNLMKRDGDYFWITISGLEADTEYAYQYLVDGEVRVGDPYATMILDPWNDKYISSSTYPNLKAYPEKAQDIVSVFSTAAPAEFNWDSFERPERNSLAVYELLFRDFSSTGDINGALKHIDYLETLGINAIELMPVMEFDGNDSWGYNPCFYFAPDKAYGTKEDYKRFINECHKRGIAVIVDVVFNHATGQFPWAKMWWDSANNCTAKENPFFNVEAPHAYSVYHDFNHTYDKTRSYIKEVLQYWLKEYNIDGYRFDLTKGIVQNPSNYDAGGYSAERIGFLKEYADAIREVSDDAYIIFEHFCDNKEEDELAAYEDILLWSNGGMEPYQQSVMGYTGGDFSGAFRQGRMNNIENHDEERIAYKAITYSLGWVKSDWAVISKQLQSAYAFHFLSPYPKMMWQFGELGYDYSINYNDRTGRKPVKWGYFNDVNRRALYDAMSKVISFRKANEDMFGDSATIKEFTHHVTDSDKGAKHMVYRTAGGSVVVVANFTENDTNNLTIKVTDNGEWTNLLTDEKVTISNGYFDVAPKSGELIILVKE